MPGGNATCRKIPYGLLKQLGIILDQGIGLCEGDNVDRGLLWLARGLERAVRLGDADLERVARANLGAWRPQLLRDGPPLAVLPTRRRPGAGSGSASTSKSSRKSPSSSSACSRRRLTNASASSADSASAKNRRSRPSSRNSKPAGRSLPRGLMWVCRSSQGTRP